MKRAGTNDQGNAVAQKLETPARPGICDAGDVRTALGSVYLAHLLLCDAKVMGEAVALTIPDY